MMTRTYAALLVIHGVLSASLSASELRVYPADVALRGADSSQRLIVVTEKDGVTLAEWTAKAHWTSTNPAVARVEADGTVRAVGDGEATLTAEVEGRTASAKVKVTQTGTPLTPSFRHRVLPVLTRAGCNSGACHGALAGKGGLKLSLRGYDPAADHFVLTRQALGRRVDRSEPAKSLMLLKPTMAVTHGGGKRFEPLSPEYRVLADWIASGAPAPAKDDPQIERIEVFPRAARLTPKQTLQLVVRAWYSDGSSLDVTRWAKFSSSEELVARVDEDGKATVAGHGEAALTVWYSNLVAATQVSSPLPNKLELDVFTRTPKKNYIDEHVLKKLLSLNIPPSPPCIDEEFIRRLYLDTAGILPTPEEVQKFLADRSPDRRAKLIDALLQRPEYVDYWTYKWSDMLLISTRRLPQPAVWSFHRFVRQSVAENVPWDRFARSILTANGSNLENGAANYFLLHTDVADLSESTAVTFMGMSITCCRCHNHPLERWTQDQYWAMANLFSRVGRKNGGRAGEVLIQPLTVGDIPHMRTGAPMPPTPLEGEPLALDSTRDRRAYFADWLTASDNPYFAHALVNRVWRNYMGRGLVEAEDDLRETNPPTNAELFDALAKDFVEHKYDVKHLIRTIANSAAYQRSSQPVAGNEADDRFYSRYLLRRLSAEVILDTYSQVTGVPTPFDRIASAAGDASTPYAGYPRGTRALELPDTLVVSQFLDSFGRPERSQTCACERQQESSVAQALHVNNGKTLNDKLLDKNSRVEAWLKEKVTDEAAIRRVYLLALSRSPTEAELKRFKSLLAEAAEDPETSRRQALEDLVWGVLTSREFLFNH